MYGTRHWTNEAILQGTLPISLIKRPADTDVATIDKIVIVTAALVNLCNSVVT